MVSLLLPCYTFPTTWQAGCKFRSSRTSLRGSWNVPTWRNQLPAQATAYPPSLPISAPHATSHTPTWSLQPAHPLSICTLCRKMPLCPGVPSWVVLSMPRGCTWMKLTRALDVGSQSFAQRILGSWVPGVASALAHRLLSLRSRSWPEEGGKGPGLRAEPCEI